MLPGGGGGGATTACLGHPSKQKAANQKCASLGDILFILQDPSSNADMTEPVTSTTTSSSTSNGLASGTTSNGLASPGELPLLKRPGFSITGR